MQIIRDNNDKSGVFMIPELKRRNVTRCNFKNCNHKPNTIGVTPQVNIGLCEEHYQYLLNRQREENLQIEFFFHENPNLDSKH